MKFFTVRDTPGIPREMFGRNHRHVPGGKVAVCAGFFFNKSYLNNKHRGASEISWNGIFTGHVLYLIVADHEFRNKNALKHQSPESESFEMDRGLKILVGINHYK